MEIFKKRYSSKPDIYFGPDIYFRDCQLPHSEEQEILSAIIDSKPTWAHFISGVATKAGQKLGALCNAASTLDAKGQILCLQIKIKNLQDN